MSFELLKNEVEKGMLGKNKGIPMGFPRLNKYIGIRKGIYTLVGGNTGLTFILDYTKVCIKINLKYLVQNKLDELLEPLHKLGNQQPS